MSETDKPLTGRQQAVLRAVEMQQRPTAAEVGEAVQISRSTAHMNLLTLERRGLVRKAGVGLTGARAWVRVTPDA